MPVDSPARALAAGTRALLRERLAPAGAEGALPFAAAVTLQVAHPLGAPASAAREREVAEGVAGVLAAARAGEGDPERRAGAAAALAADVALLSACFQNLDLLPHGDPTGDAMALLVLEALGALNGA